MSFTEKDRDDALTDSITQAADTGLKFNVRIIAKGCCEECMKMDGKIIPLEEELLNRRLPQKNCKRTRTNFCICSYGLIPVRDENGRAIRIKKGFFQK